MARSLRERSAAIWRALSIVSRTLNRSPAAGGSSKPVTSAGVDGGEVLGLQDDGQGLSESSGGRADSDFGSAEGDAQQEPQPRREREFAQRERIYPRWINAARPKLSPNVANQRQARLRAAINTLKRLKGVTP